MNTSEVVQRRVLSFINDSHYIGQQSTVRLGTKWADVSPGEIIRLAEAGSDPTAEAKIIHVLMCKLKDVPQFILSQEHDRSCRDMLGLEAALVRAYGDTFTPESVVTCLVYDTRV